MVRIIHDADVQNWPKMPQVLNKAAARLQAQHGEGSIPREALMREVEMSGGYRRDSVIPSDYCYNVINKAPYSFQHPVLVRVERGRYKYVGPGYRYIGSVVWKPKGGAERQVGTWSAGLCDLEMDPRQPSTSSRR